MKLEAFNLWTVSHANVICACPERNPLLNKQSQAEIPLRIAHHILA